MLNHRLDIGIRYQSNFFEKKLIESAKFGVKSCDYLVLAFVNLFLSGLARWGTRTKGSECPQKFETDRNFHGDEASWSRCFGWIYLRDRKQRDRTVDDRMGCDPSPLCSLLTDQAFSAFR